MFVSVHYALEFLVKVTKLKMSTCFWEALYLALPSDLLRILQLGLSNKFGKNIGRTL